MGKGIGLVGNIAYWGVSGLFVGYCCKKFFLIGNLDWEIDKMRNSMPLIDEDHVEFCSDFLAD